MLVKGVTLLGAKVPGPSATTTNFCRGKINQLDKSLVGTARKTTRGFKSQAERVFPQYSGDPGHYCLS